MSAKEENSQRSSIESDIPPTFYNKVGQDIIIDITKLTKLVIERYKILRRIEKFYRNKKKIKFYVKDNLPEEIRWEKNDDNYIKNDISSFFILALIMCRNEIDKRWFIRQETKLYMARIYILRRYSMYKILLNLGLSLKELKEEDDPSIDIDKIRFRLIKNPRKKENEKIYFCKFEDALNLVMTHDYYIYMGNIYIPESDLPSLFKLVFIQNMDNTISKIRANLENIIKDNRIREIILLFNKEKDYIISEEAAKIIKNMPNNIKLRTMNDVDLFAEKCFPLCMTLIERHLNKYSHLNHYGRLQFSLFLKGAGLPVQETLKFFQKKYEKKITLEKFEKEYAYNIKHSYGLEGRRISYAPYTCNKLIQMIGPIGKECHGCPFKTYSTDKLRDILNTCNLKPMDIEAILNKKKRNQFQQSCVKYFKGKFPEVPTKGIGIHPNKYFTSAMKAIKNIKDKEKDKISKVFKGDNKIENIEEDNKIKGFKGDNKIEYFEEDDKIEDFEENNKIEDFEENNKIENLKEDNKIEDFKEDNKIEIFEEENKFEDFFEDNKIEDFFEDNKIWDFVEDNKIEDFEEENKTEDFEEDNKMDIDKNNGK